MAALNFLGGFLYEAVRQTWFISAVVLKYFLAALILSMLYRNELSLDKLQENLLDYGKPVLLGVTALGFVFSTTGFSITPGFRFISELVAVLLLGFLFWKY